MPKAKVGDIHLYYEVHGKGEPLILIMGASGTTGWWGPLVPLLSQEFRVVIFDNRGAGNSDLPDAPFTTRTMADDTIGLMDVLGIDAAHILGFSMGGLVAQELARRHPQRLLSLIFTGTTDASAVVPESVRAASRQAAMMPMEQILPIMISMLFSKEFIAENPAKIEEFKARALEKPITSLGRLRQLDAIEKHDSADGIAQIKAPALVVAGQLDCLVSMEHQKDFAARLPQAEFKVVPDGGHLFFFQYPEQASAIFREFLKRHS